MFSITVLFTVFLAGALGQNLEQCNKLNCSTMHCCTMDSVQKSSEALAPLLKDCLALPMGSCERAICAGTKSGYARPDGTVDKTKAVAMIEKDFNGQDDIIQAIKDKCLNGDISIYGLPDDCDLVRHQRCVRLQILGRCTSWDSAGSCSGIKEAAEDCFTSFA